GAGAVPPAPRLAHGRDGLQGGRPRPPWSARARGDPPRVAGYTVQDGPPGAVRCLGAGADIDRIASVRAAPLTLPSPPSPFRTPGRPPAKGRRSGGLPGAG